MYSDYKENIENIAKLNAAMGKIQNKAKEKNRPLTSQELGNGCRTGSRD